MTRFFGKIGRGLAVAAALLAAIGLTTAPRPADAGGIGPGAAVGIWLGAFALGSVLANPYRQPYYYPYSYYVGYNYPPAAAYYPATPYYPTTPYYPPTRSCWNAYTYSYYAC